MFDFKRWSQVMGIFKVSRWHIYIFKRSGCCRNNHNFFELVFLIVTYWCQYCYLYIFLKADVFREDVKQIRYAVINLKKTPELSYFIALLFCLLYLRAVFQSLTKSIACLFLICHLCWHFVLYSSLKKTLNVQTYLRLWMLSPKKTQPGFLKIWKPFFLSEHSIIVFKDTFWWFFLHSFKVWHGQTIDVRFF